MGRTGRRGFTLIEALVTIAVLAILTTLALPSFSARLTQHRLKSAAEHLALDMAEARFQAAQSAKTLHLVFGGAGPDWCYAVALSPGCDCRTAQPCQLKTVRAQDIPGVLVELVRDAQFDPMATDSPGGGAEFVSRHGERLRVSLSPLGRAQICAPSPLPGYPGC